MLRNGNQSQLLRCDSEAMGKPHQQEGHACQMNEDYPSAIDIANDYAKRAQRKMEHRQGATLKNGKAGDASYLRIGRSTMEAGKSNKGKHSKVNPSEIFAVLRATERIRRKLIQIGKFLGKIGEVKENRGGRLRSSGKSKERRKPSCDAVCNQWVGRSQEASIRSRNGTRSL